MGLSGGLVLYEPSAEHSFEALSAFAAAANQAHSASRQPLDCRYADLLLQAAGHRFSLVDVKIERPAHDRAFRFAAAKASLALE